MKRKCKDCNTIFESYSSLQNRCFECSKLNYKPIKEGKRTKEWKKFRKDYLEEQGTNHQGYFVCPDGSWTKNPDLDHRKKRSTNPELVFTKSNIEMMTPEKHRLEKHGL